MALLSAVTHAFWNVSISISSAVAAVVALAAAFHFLLTLEQQCTIDSRGKNENTRDKISTGNADSDMSA
jgi:anti-sigma-K factor RskA